MINLLAYSQQVAQENSYWFRNGPFCARIQSLAMAPSNTNVIYIGTHSTGLYKTNSGGETWSFCSTEYLPIYEDTLSYSPSLPCWWYGDHYPIDAIAVHPQDENHLWISSLERGLLESTDGGNTWQKVSETLPDILAVNFISINPENYDDILLGTGKYFTVGSPQNGGLYRTLDGGNTWNIVEGIPHGKSYLITSIKRNPVDNNHIMIGISSNGEPDFSWGIMESYDNGNNWQVVNDSFPVHDICINPANPQNLWGVAYTGWLDWWLMNSQDSGQTWNLYEGFEDPYEWVTSIYADNDFNLYIERDSENPDCFSFSILNSSDNGLTWNNVDKLVDKISDGERTMKLTNCCQAETSNTDNIYFGNYFGVFHSIDGGISTLEQNTNLMNSYIGDLEIHPRNNDEIYAAGGQGLWKSTDAGRNWERKVIDPVGCTKYNPLYHDTLYYGGRDPMRSYDGGISWQNIRHTIVGGIMDIAINPKYTNVVYLFSGVDENVFSLYKSTDYGDTWDLVFVSYNNENYTHIIIDPQHTDTVYFGNNRSLDNGLTWEKNALGQFRIDGIHPQNSNILYGSTYWTGNNDIQVSYDWGITFQLMDEYLAGQFPNNNIRKFAIAKDNPDYLYYCTGNDGIHYSVDAGSNWQKFEGEYNSRTTEIIPLLNENKYLIATHGDGVYVYDTTYTNSVFEKPYSNKGKCLFVWPNPFKGSTKIKYFVKDPGFVNITVYDFQGREINTIVNVTKNIGEYELIWDSKDLRGKELAAGLYFARLISDRNVDTQKLILTK